VRILSHRLQRAVAVLGLRRVVVVASAVILVAGFMIVPVEVFLRYRKRLLKNMMDTMGRGGREKKHKKGDDPHGADGAEIAKNCSHCIDNCL
jgi:hypothetical protein